MNQDFLCYCEKLYLERYRNEEITYHTWYNAQSTFRDFRQFCLSVLQVESVSLEQIGPGFLQQYKLYCVGKGNSTATVNRKLVPFMVSIRQAVEEGLLPGPSYAQLKQAYFSGRKRRYGPEACRLSAEEGEPVRHLSDTQIRQLLEWYDKVASPGGRRVLDLFFFSFHACGLRISDIVTLEWAHVDFAQARLQKLSVKSKALITIPLSDPALEILRRWQDKGPGGRFVFDLLPDGFDLTDDEKLSRVTDSRNHSIRVALNRIGRRLGFPFPLSMHVARHTFAVKALNEGKVSVHLISRLLGHTSVLVTEKVYARFLLQTLRSEVREKLSFFDFSLQNTMKI